MAFLQHTMLTMKFSSRDALTVIAAALILGGLLRLGVDKRRVEVALPEVVDLPAQAQAKLAP